MWIYCTMNNDNIQLYNANISQFWPIIERKSVELRNLVEMYVIGGH